jgi:AraC-like DNA-binding protein
MVWIADIGMRVAGPLSRFVRPPDLPHMHAFGARFHPGIAPYLLHTPASALVDGHVFLDEIDARFATRLHERLGNTDGTAERVRAFADELWRRLRHVDEPDRSVREAVRVLARPGTTVAEAAARAFVSERQLQRRFRDDVGYSPKTLQRVLRFDRFMRVLREPRIDLATAAALAGYADQPHLTREARRLSGLSPRQLLGYTH